MVERTENLGITVTKSEKQAVRQAAAVSGLTMSSFLRSLILSNDTVQKYLFLPKALNAARVAECRRARGDQVDDDEGLPPAA